MQTKTSDGVVVPSLLFVSYLYRNPIMLIAKFAIVYSPFFFLNLHNNSVIARAGRKRNRRPMTTFFYYFSNIHLFFCSYRSCFNSCYGFWITRPKIIVLSTGFPFSVIPVYFPKTPFTNIAYKVF